MLDHRRETMLRIAGGAPAEGIASRLDVLDHGTFALDLVTHAIADHDGVAQRFLGTHETAARDGFDPFTGVGEQKTAAEIDPDDIRLAAAGTRVVQLQPAGPRSGSVTVKSAPRPFAFAAAILVATASGQTARDVARYRPQAPILAATPNPIVERQMRLVWGVVPVHSRKAGTSDQIIRDMVELAMQEKLAKEGDRVVVTAGMATNMTGATNMMTVQVIKKSGEPTR